MTASRVGVFPLAYMLLAKGSYALAGALLTWPLRRVYRRVFASPLTLATQIALVVASSYVAAVAWTVISNFVTVSYIDPLFRDGRQVAVSSRLLLGGALYNAFVVLAWSTLYFGIKWYDALNEQRERTLRAEADANRAQLEALRYQLHPHFLFNALNGVSALVRDGRTSDATRMIANLASLLRISLDTSRGNTVALDDELQTLRAYLDVEEARFGDRLHIVIEVPQECRRASVPLLLLQPIVENAVRHVMQSSRDSTVHIAAARHGETLTVSVTNELSGTPPAPDAERDALGIGIPNTLRRLEALYGSNASCTVDSSARSYAVRITLPFEPA